MSRYRKGHDTPPRGRKNAQRWHANRPERLKELFAHIGYQSMREPRIVEAWQKHMEASMRDPIAGFALRIIPHDCALAAPLLYDDETEPKET